MEAHSSGDTTLVCSPALLWLIRIYSGRKAAVCGLGPRGEGLPKEASVFALGTKSPLGTGP